MKTKKEVVKFVNEELKVRADELAEYLLAQEQLECPEIEEGRIVCETWLVSTDMSYQLKKMGEPVAEAFNNHFWFRCATGKPPKEDATFIKALGATWE